MKCITTEEDPHGRNQQQDDEDPPVAGQEAAARRRSGVRAESIRSRLSLRSLGDGDRPHLFGRRVPSLHHGDNLKATLDLVAAISEQKLTLFSGPPSLPSGSVADT